MLIGGQSIKFNTHHPKECFVSQGLVLFNGGQNAEDQTGQNYEEPAENTADHTSFSLPLFIFYINQLDSDVKQALAYIKTKFFFQMKALHNLSTVKSCKHKTPQSTFLHCTSYLCQNVRL